MFGPSGQQSFTNLGDKTQKSKMAANFWDY